MSGDRMTVDFKDRVTAERLREAVGMAIDEQLAAARNAIARVIDHELALRRMKEAAEAAKEL